MKKSFFKVLFLAGIVATITSACNSKGDNPGWIYMPDMTYSNAYETYSSTHHQTQNGDSISALLPVDGTIPRGYVPSETELNTNEKYLNSFVYKNYMKNPIAYPAVDNEQRAKAKDMLSNPYRRTDEIMAKGKEKYDIYCAVCHGKEGEGDGSIVVRKDGTDGPFVSIPPNFKTSAENNGRLHGLTDGEMFYSITYGKNMMGGYYSQVSPEDRWKIIHYIKNMAGIPDNYAGATNAPVQLDMSKVEAKVGTQIDVPNIYFATGSAELKKESLAVLDQLISFFEKNKNVVVEIGSHSDARGDDNKNLSLSEQRAATVVKYLVSKKVAETQLKAKGYGETAPAVPCGENCTDLELEKNRRTTFKVLQVN